MHDIRSALRQSPKLQPLLDSISELPSLFQCLVAHEPCLERTPGRWCALQLTRWLEHDLDAIEDQIKEYWNSISAPLSVLFGMVQYFQYLQDNDISHKQLLGNISDGGCQGFCLGLLPATAVSNSRDETAIILLSPSAFRSALECIWILIKPKQGQLQHSCYAANEVWT